MELPYRRKVESVVYDCLACGFGLVPKHRVGCAHEFAGSTTEIWRWMIFKKPLSHASFARVNQPALAALTCFCWRRRKLRPFRVNLDGPSGCDENCRPRTPLYAGAKTSRIRSYHRTPTGAPPNYKPAAVGADAEAGSAVQHSIICWAARRDQVRRFSPFLWEVWLRSHYPTT